MKKTIIVCNLLFSSLFFNAQTNLKQYKAGHTFSLSVQSYMTQTSGLNDVAVIQFKNKVKDVYTIAIVDTKEELKLLEVNYSTLTEYYDQFISTFLKNEASKKFSTPITTKKGAKNFMEFDATYYDSETKIDFYYLIGLVETEKSFYRIVSWTLLDNKDKFKADFQNTLYSLID